MSPRKKKVSQKREARVSVAEARRIVQESMDAEKAREVAEKRKLIGRFYKYYNSYGGDYPRWWMYGRVEAVSESGYITGLTFQRTSRGIIEIEIEGPMHVHPESEGTGACWQPITASEFWKAAAPILRETRLLLSGEPLA